MMKIKQWILYNFIAPISYRYWIRLREGSKDEYGERLCYCGHTDKCYCPNPGKQLFRESVRNGSIILTDKNNGWGNCYTPDVVGQGEQCNHLESYLVRNNSAGFKCKCGKEVTYF